MRDVHSCAGGRSLLHQRQRVALAVCEESHPLLEAGVLVDEDAVRLVRQLDPAAAELRVGRLDVVNDEVEDRARLPLVLVLAVQVQARPVEVEEGQVAEREHMRQPERLAIKLLGAGDVAHVERDLAQRGEGERRSRRHDRTIAAAPATGRVAGRRTRRAFRAAMSPAAHCSRPRSITKRPAVARG